MKNITYSNIRSVAITNLKNVTKKDKTTRAVADIVFRKGKNLIKGEYWFKVEDISLLSHKVGDIIELADYKGSDNKVYTEVITTVGI
jgi:hypothetical protein|tara:strand:+ start:36 stop:296 length:261 start_codon:yes stop_codon:yes gene_type:complete